MEIEDAVATVLEKTVAICCSTHAQEQLSNSLYLMFLEGLTKIIIIILFYYPTEPDSHLCKIVVMFSGCLSVYIFMHDIQEPCEIFFTGGSHSFIRICRFILISTC